MHLPMTVPIKRIAHDEEKLLEHVEEGSKDAVVSVMGLHWVNDLPGQLTPRFRTACL
jgi:hypothetical protein